ncbi:phosphate starvation-inducible protein PhoH [Cytobacillus sp. FSL K6-0265]|uniref:phosphate starvation-inducible protein PhoH n=1 Tax=Cytobacillus sp. FSL K6-0265 TaxID=2921448 RepID=UPI0030FAEC79
MTIQFISLNAGGVFAQTRLENQDSTGFTHVDIYELPYTDLTPYACLVIGGMCDQDFLFEHKEIISSFLDEGKIVVFSGNLVTDWLPGGRPFVPKEIKSFQDYAVKIASNHPIFEGVLEDDMTFNKGVAGFFARGHHPLPEGAEVLLTLDGKEPITYIDRQSTNGTILVHVGFDLFGYMGSNDLEKTTSRISPQLKQWVEEEYSKTIQGVQS